MTFDDFIDQCEIDIRDEEEESIVRLMRYAWNASRKYALEDAAKEVETRWNCNATLVNQKEQEERSAAVLRKMMLKEV